MKAAEKESIAGNPASGEADCQPSLPQPTDDMMDALPWAAVSKSNDEDDASAPAAADYDMEELD